MKELKQHQSRDLTIARKVDGNPEGKGVNGFLLDWQQTQPRGVIAKPRRQVLAEFFTSMLVLSAELKYKPVVGVQNYLYWINNEWSLSLIAPDEWSAERRASYAGACILQSDMTWTITPSDLLAEENAVSDAAGRFYDAFAESLDTDLTLQEILPFHISKLGYYPRLYASALSRSIRRSVNMSALDSDNCRDWQKLMPQLGGAFLLHKE